VLEVVPDPAYGISLGTAQVRILDRIEFPQQLGITATPDGAWEVLMTGAPGQQLVLEASTDLQLWSALRTNRLFNSTGAVVRVPGGPASRYFRTVRP